MGNIAGAYTRILNVCTQRNVIAGAVLIELPSMYPAAPATMHPTASPTMMEMFLRNGEPKSSVRMMDTNERKPRPMNSGEPQGSGLGAKMVGQSWKMPDVGLRWQSFEPESLLAYQWDGLRNEHTSSP